VLGSEVDVGTGDNAALASVLNALASHIVEQKQIEGFDDASPQCSSRRAPLPVFFRVLRLDHRAESAAFGARDVLRLDFFAITIALVVMRPSPSPRRVFLC